MQVNFEWQGLSFEGDISVKRGRPGVHTLRNGDPGYPPEADEIELTDLQCEGNDAQFLAQIDDVMEAALKAAEKQSFEHRGEAAAENRAYMRTWSGE